MTFLESIFYMAWRGIAIGLIISAPMGPVGMLCIQRTLDKGRRAGFYTGIGAAISDLFYSLLTGFGLSFIEEFLERNSNVIQLAGSAVLIGFGVYLFRKNPAKALKRPVDEPVSVRKNILGGFLFTFSNPLILFLIVGLFARFNFLLPEHHLGQYFTGFLFIFIGALIWWWFITFAVSKVRNHFNIRSMWLINRIIGVIIMLFAVVGIVTATTALAKGANPSLLNSTPAPRPSSPVPRPFELRFKARCASAGSEWAMVLPDAAGRDSAVISIRSIEMPHDGISSRPALRVALALPGARPLVSYFESDPNPLKLLKGRPEGVDPTGGMNFYRLTLLDGVLSLAGGLHSPKVLLQAALPEGLRPDTVLLRLPPQARMEISEMAFTRLDVAPEPLWSAFADAAAIDAYLAASRLPREGYMNLLDRSLDESLLRLGGDYRLAMVTAPDGGLDLIYVSGATHNADAWLPGMVKARLRPSGIEGVWDVEWRDAMHLPMARHLKGQFDADGTLTIQFPYQHSTLRLTPTN